MADGGEGGGGQSKSAKRRAAKKAREGGAGEEQEDSAPTSGGYPAVKAEAKSKSAPPLAPQPEAKAKAKAKAKADPEPKAEAKAKAQPKAKVEAKAKAEPKAKAEAKAKAEPKAKAEAKAKAEPKAKAEAKAKAEPKATGEPKAKAETKAKAEPKAKAKAKAKPTKEEEEEEPKVKAPEPVHYEMDDGTGGDWEVSTGISKKQQKRVDRLKEEAAEKEELSKAPKNHVPGMGPVQQQHIPGMAPPPAAKAKAGAKGAEPVAALAAVTAAAAEKKGEAPDKAAEGNATTATISVPEAKIGIVIGPKGAKIKMIQEKTGVTRIDTTGEIFTISGPPDAVAMALGAIKELIDKGYCAMQYDNFSENFVSVHPTSFPDIIGKQGAIIRKMKDELGVEVNIPETPKNCDPKKKFKVTIAGAAAAVEKAKAVINDICMYGHSDLTHPGYHHEELEIADWCYRFLIGKNGSEMRHIQNNYKVKVNIPRETSINQKVVVCGEKDGVERAKVYIDKLIWNAENQSKGRDRDQGGGDDMGDDDAEEDWMKPYLFKRR